MDIGSLLSGAQIYEKLSKKIKKLLPRKIKVKLIHVRKLKIYRRALYNPLEKIDLDSNTIFLFRYKILNENDNFIIDNVETYVKFKNSDELIKFEEYYSNSISYGNRGGGQQLLLPLERTLIGNGLIENNVQYDLFSTCFVNENIEDEIESIELKIIDTEGKLIITKITVNEYLKNRDISIEFWDDKIIV